MNTLTATGRADRREQDRQDRIVRAQIDRDREAARIQARIAEQAAAARVALDAAAARRAARAAARDDRAARLAGMAAWASAHVTGLLFLPVIGVPALLSWTAMGAFGMRLYGIPGVTLPAFSEGAMWAFAAAVTLTLHRYPGRPVWHLRAGIAVFAVFSAALNFLHGLATPTALFPGLPAGYLTGSVMALISIAGVIAHQLITAGPRGKHAAALDPDDDERQGDEPAAAPGDDPDPAPDEPEAGEPAPVPVAELPAAPEVAERADDVAPAPVPAVPASNIDAAEMAFRATHAAGNPLSVRKLQDRFGLTRGQATKVRNRVIAEPGDGQADEPGGYAIPAAAEPAADDAPEPVAV
jgi:hypothetical protein